MATPSSSTTTPSPLLGYRRPNGVVPSSKIVNAPRDALEAEERERAVQKFLAGAELSKLTRSLRTRLGYASYKATHNLSASTLRDLEAQTPSLPISYPRPAFAPQPGVVAGSPLVRKGSMGPPPVTASAGQSLFASLLGPPPAKRARTIRNPQDPHVPAPIRPPSIASPGRRNNGSEPSRASQSSINTSVAERTRSHVKGPKRDIRKKPRAAKKSKDEGLNDVDDMKAAATLTSLLMHSRPGAVTASSPRSSISGRSDTGSTYSHFAQSSTRTTTDGTLPGGANNPSKTPPPAKHGHGRTSKNKRGAGGLPKPAATDSEAAELMMFLATSPSPARPSANRDKDAEAYRALGGGVSALKGRVLFPGTGEGYNPGRILSRDATGSFASTITAVGDAGNDASASLSREVTITSSALSAASTFHDLSQSEGNKVDEDIRMETIVIPVEAQPSHLLPPPTSPPVSHSAPPELPSSPLHSAFGGGRPFEFLSTDSKQNNTPRTPGNVVFNLNEFINVSPSPATPHGGSVLALSRADVGRKLFADDHQVKGIVDSDGGHPGRGNCLGAGIDFVGT